MTKKRISQALWTGCSEREVLFGLRHEIAQPIVELKGYCNLFLKADLSEQDRSKTIEHILSRIEFLESLHNSLEEYLRESPNSETIESG